MFTKEKFVKFNEQVSLLAFFVLFHKCSLQLSSIWHPTNTLQKKRRSSLGKKRIFNRKREEKEAYSFSPEEK